MGSISKIVVKKSKNLCPQKSLSELRKSRKKMKQFLGYVGRKILGKIQKSLDITREIL